MYPFLLLTSYTSLKCLPIIFFVLLFVFILCIYHFMLVCIPPSSDMRLLSPSRLFLYVCACHFKQSVYQPVRSRLFNYFFLCFAMYAPFIHVTGFSVLAHTTFISFLSLILCHVSATYFIMFCLKVIVGLIPESLRLQGQVTLAGLGAYRTPGECAKSCARSSLCFCS